MQGETKVLMSVEAGILLAGIVRGRDGNRYPLGRIMFGKLPIVEFQFRNVDVETLKLAGRKKLPRSQSK